MMRVSTDGRLVRVDLPQLKAELRIEGDHDGDLYDRDGRVVGSLTARVVGQVSDIGDRYKQALARRLGGVPCGACAAEQKRLNTLTAEQVRAEREAIIEATVQRAKNLPRWRDRIRAKLGDAIAPETTRRIIGECLDEALG